MHSQHSSRLPWWLSLCAVAFVAAVAGAVVCGEKMTADPDRADYLRLLIYAHFALAESALVAAGVLLYMAHSRWKRYYLIVAYNEKGMALNPPGIRMPRRRVRRCCLGSIRREQLPPPGVPVLVYPMFMLSGRSSGERLEEQLRQAYAGVVPAPQLYFQPVLGASPWLAQAAADYLNPMLAPGVGVLLVAHGSSLPEPPPEPALFCRRLRELLPAGTEVRYGYFSQEPSAHEVLATMEASHVLLLPFLLTEGVHTARDLPTPQQAAACGKTLQRLPVVAALLPTHDDP